MLGLDGAIISEEGQQPRYRPDHELHQAGKKGIKTVILTDDYAGRDGARPWPMPTH